MLLANNINFKRNNKDILKNINLSISSKKILHIIGGNGIGKTTLLKIITNIITPDSGEIIWNGKNIKKNPFDLYADLTFIMDKQTSNNQLTVEENIKFWCKLFSSKINNKEIGSLLVLLSLDNYRKTQVSNLSFGEIKKLELSRLIIEQKKLWILDEPYIGIDKSTSDLISQTMLNHVNLGGMVIFTSHINPLIKDLKILNLENDVDD